MPRFNAVTPRPSADAALGLSGTNPKSPFKGDHDPSSIPTAADNDAGLECAHVDTRRNQHTVAAAELGVAPKREPRGAKLEGTARGSSAQTLDKYNQWRAAQGQQPAPAAAPDHKVATGYLHVEEPKNLPPAPPATMYFTKSPAEEFLEQKTRVTIELADGIFTLPAVSVRQSTYCVMVLVPLSDDVSIFVPKPGTELTLAHKDDRLKAYFPGAYVEYPELGVAAMTFIKAEA